ncbi:hypothetical protein [Salinibacter sp. 10B]|uniref:hypothetical protein n=1 Tax=Salinibacter sp. 10B TaxID=1923971 RepID=UPI0011B0DFF1|nr:hypothetical protein [Salinibacter sp. 10B]
MSRSKRSILLRFRWLIVAVPLGMAMLLMEAARPAPAHAQSELAVSCSPWLLLGRDCPVMDVVRRIAEAEYADGRKIEHQQKRLEELLSAIESSNLSSFVFTDAPALLEQVELTLKAGSGLAYSSSRLLGELDTHFLSTLGPDYDPGADAPARYDELLQAYRSIGGTGRQVGAGLTDAAGRVRAVQQGIEDVGQLLGFSLPGIGSPRQSAQAELQMAIYNAEETIQMRQAIALQTNAEILSYMDRVADDRMETLLLQRAIQGPLLPLLSPE